jgi:hypothetical protein
MFDERSADPEHGASLKVELVVCHNRDGVHVVPINCFRSGYQTSANYTIDGCAISVV